MYTEFIHFFLFIPSFQNDNKKIREWIQVHAPDKDELQDVWQVVWLPMSIMDHISQCCVSMGKSFCCDISIVCDQIKVTSMNEQGGYQCVWFFSSKELDLFLRGQLYTIFFVFSSLDNLKEKLYLEIVY